MHSTPCRPLQSSAQLLARRLCFPVAPQELPSSRLHLGRLSLYPRCHSECWHGSGSLWPSSERPRPYCTGEPLNTMLGRAVSRKRATGQRMQHSLAQVSAIWFETLCLCNTALSEPVAWLLHRVLNYYCTQDLNPVSAAGSAPCADSAYMTLCAAPVLAWLCCELVAK